MNIYVLTCRLLPPLPLSQRQLNGEPLSACHKADAQHGEDHDEDGDDDDAQHGNDYERMRMLVLIINMVIIIMG